MPSVTINGNVTGGGVTMASVVSRTVDSVSGIEPATAIGVAYALSSWVKTDADTAAGNLTAGHGQTTGNYDVFWEVSGVAQRRYGVVCTITTNAVALDGGAGGDFPASANATVRICKQVNHEVSWDGDQLEVFAAGLRVTGSASGGRGSLAVYDISDVLIAQLDLPLATLDIAGGASNPLAGSLAAYVLASNASTSATGTLQIIAGESTS